MAKFREMPTVDQANPAAQKVTPLEALIDTLETWIRKRGRLPEPLPVQPADAARWWIDQIQEPRMMGEYAQKTTLGEIDPYIARLRATIVVYLDFGSVQDRQFVVAGIQDGVRWRGESIEIYRKIYEETMRMGEIGFVDYRKQAIAGMRAAIKKICLRD